MLAARACHRTITGRKGTRPDKGGTTDDRRLLSTGLNFDRNKNIHIYP